MEVYMIPWHEFAQWSSDDIYMRGVVRSIEERDTLIAALLLANVKVNAVFRQPKRQITHILQHTPESDPLKRPINVGGIRRKPRCGNYIIFIEIIYARAILGINT